jgi:hypothetical protein
MWVVEIATEVAIFTFVPTRQYCPLVGTTSHDRENFSASSRSSDLISSIASCARQPCGYRPAKNVKVGHKVLLPVQILNVNHQIIRADDPGAIYTAGPVVVVPSLVSARPLPAAGSPRNFPTKSVVGFISQVDQKQKTICL